MLDLGDGVRGLVVAGDNLDVMAQLPDGIADLVYIDPPFNTGKMRTHTRLRTVADGEGDRVGFGGRRYRSVALGTSAYVDVFDDYLAFLEPRLRELRRLLAAQGSIYVHLDWRESHYVKVLGDAVFGRDAFLNEVVWAYDYGGRSRRRWPPKHDVLLVWVKDPDRYWFDDAEVDRIPYMAPSLVGAVKAERGKLPTDTWWHTVVPTSGAERTGYPTQKPLGVLRRVVAASCPPGGVVVDVFAGSGTAGAAALELGRRFVCVDDNPEAMRVMRARFGEARGLRWVPRDAGVVNDAPAGSVSSMIEARAQATVPAPPEEVFATATDLDHADWLPAVRHVRRLDGPVSGVGARYSVEVGLLGRTLGGVLVCREYESPRRFVLVLEEGLDLTITVDVTPVPGGSDFELVAAFSVGGGPLASVAERAASGPARREVGRSVEQLASRFGRKANVKDPT